LQFSLQTASPETFEYTFVFYQKLFFEPISSTVMRLALVLEPSQIQAADQL
jgi:hypothetical protein